MLCRGDCSKQEIIAFTQTPDAPDAFELWFGENHWDCDRADCGLALRDRVKCDLQSDIATIDRVLDRVLNLITLEQRILRLEAAWLGVSWLVREKGSDQKIQISVLNVAWHEIMEDAASAVDFDQSVLFRMVYEEAFGSPGADPIGLLLVDTEIDHRRQVGEDDPCSTLFHIAEVAASAFCPTVIGASPALFGIETWSSLPRLKHLPQLLRQDAYRKWRELRRREDSRFLAISLPRVLMRQNAAGHLSAIPARFPFQVDAVDGRAGMVWGNSVFAVGAAAVASFLETGWFENLYLGWEPFEQVIRPISTPVYYTGCDHEISRPVVNVAVPHSIQRELSNCGLTVLSHRRYQDGCGMLTAPMFLNADDETGDCSMNRLDLILGASRMSHYLKAIARNAIGEFLDPVRLEQRLNKWLLRYVKGTSLSSSEYREQFSWASARVTVTEINDRSGSCACHLSLRPHAYPDEISLAFRLER
jgi:type VI secretion system protein ImpD